jgi:predicted phage terminase large subunit-like protein
MPATVVTHHRWSIKESAIRRGACGFRCNWLQGVYAGRERSPPRCRDGILKSVRYWDKAGSKDAGAYTAGVLMHRMKDGRFVIEHVARGQWSALEREQQIKYWAEHDKGMLRHTPYEIGVEQEPGSGGKESAEATLRMLAGYRCFADKVTGSKEIRAEPLAAQVQAGNVFLVAGAWHSAFLDECESFPNGKFKDQVDAAAGAFARLTGKPAYNLDAMAT